jgi:hypothetical protein
VRASRFIKLNQIDCLIDYRLPPGINYPASDHAAALQSEIDFDCLTFTDGYGFAPLHGKRLVARPDKTRGIGPDQIISR